MSKILNRLGFVYKKPKRRPCKVSVEKQDAFLNNYFDLIENLTDDESVYFIDASGFEHNSKMDYGWIKKGKNKEIKSNTGRKKLNVNGAYNPITHKVITIDYEDNTTSQHNIELVQKIIKSNPDKKKITLILDNASMNKSKDFKDFIYKQSDIKIHLFFLPPYSPNLNLIERLWRFSKKKLLSNRYYKTFLRFKEALTYFFENTLNDLKAELKTLMTNKFQIYNIA
jgi:transposase